jgi:hypothetical protein
LFHVKQQPDNNLYSFHPAVPRGTTSCHGGGHRIHLTPSYPDRSERRLPAETGDEKGIADPGAAPAGGGSPCLGGAARERPYQREDGEALPPREPARQAPPPTPDRSIHPHLRSAWRAENPDAQNSGFLAGTPLRRGKRSGHSSRWRKVRYSNPSWITSAGSSPSWRSGSVGHRVS